MVVRFWLFLAAAAVGGLFVVAGIFAFAQRLGDVDLEPRPTPGIWALWVVGGVLLLGGLAFGELALVRRCTSCGRRLRRGRSCVCRSEPPDLPP